MDVPLIFFFLIMATYCVEGILAWILVKYGLVYLDVGRRKSCIYIQLFLLGAKIQVFSRYELCRMNMFCIIELSE